MKIIFFGTILSLLSVYIKAQTSMSRPQKNTFKKPEKFYKPGMGKYLTRDGRIKQGTVVIVSMKDGSTTEAKVMKARSRKIYWLNQKGGNRHGMCHIRFMKIKDVASNKDVSNQQKTHSIH